MVEVVREGEGEGRGEGDVGNMQAMRCSLLISVQRQQVWHTQRRVRRGANECKEKESGREGESKRGESIGKPVVRLLLLLVAPQAHTLLILILFHFFTSSFSLFCFVSFF